MTDSQNGSHPTKLRIGSRGSQLALWQANHISALLRARGHEVEIEIIHTTGDKITDVALAMVGTKGMFTKEIEEALAAGRARGHIQLAPSGATQGHPPRSRHSSSARQRRYPPAQTRTRRIRRHHPCLGRTEAPRQDRIDQADHSR